MGSILYYQCDLCSEYAQLTIGFDGYYWTPDTISPMLHYQTAWCYCCNSLTQAEKLLAPDELVEFHRSLSRLVEEQSDQSIGVQKIFDGQLESGIRLHKFRRKPPRCLRCGSTNIQYFSIEDRRADRYQHPDCGGYFTTSEPDWYEHIEHILFEPLRLTSDGLPMHNMSRVGKLKSILQYCMYFLRASILSMTEFLYKPTA